MLQQTHDTFAGPSLFGKIRDSAQEIELSLEEIHSQNNQFYLFAANGTM